MVSVKYIFIVLAADDDGKCRSLASLLRCLYGLATFVPT